MEKGTETKGTRGQVKKCERVYRKKAKRGEAISVGNCDQEVTKADTS